jgi:hypothetical protein
VHDISYRERDQRKGEARGVDVDEEEGLAVGAVGEDVLRTTINDQSASHLPEMRYKRAAGAAGSKLTLARKLDSVQRNTTANRSIMPRVRRATPPRPSLSLMLLPPVVALESVVMAEDVARESGASGSVDESIAAVTECDLRLEDEACA